MNGNGSNVSPRSGVGAGPLSRAGRQASGSVLSRPDTLRRMDTRLRDMVALVTGASGGIGRAVAEALAGEGCRLALHANRSREALAGWVASQPWRAQAFCGQADLRSLGETAAFIDAARAALGRIDICVVNAGIWPPEPVALQRWTRRACAPA